MFKLKYANMQLPNFVPQYRYNFLWILECPRFYSLYICARCKNELNHAEEMSRAGHLRPMHSFQHMLKYSYKPLGFKAIRVATLLPKQKKDQKKDSNDVVRNRLPAFEIKIFKQMSIPFNVRNIFRNAFRRQHLHLILENILSQVVWLGQAQ